MTLPLCSDAVSVAIVTGATRLISSASSLPGRIARTRNESAKKPTPAPKATTCAWLSQPVEKGLTETGETFSNSTTLSEATRLVPDVVASDNFGPVTREVQKTTKPARTGNPENVRTS